MRNPVVRPADFNPITTPAAAAAITTEDIMSATETKQLPDLAGFTGGGDQYRHWLKRLRYTEGVKHMADAVGAYWLIDAIASHQGKKVDRACEGMQFWELSVRAADHKATLICRRDSGLPAVVQQEIEYSDFPPTDLGETDAPFKIWVSDNCMMLPSEY
jgi:hypothetical protein